MATAVLKFTTVPVTSKYGPRPRFSVPHKGADTANGSKYPHSVFGDGVVTFAGRRPRGHPDYERGIHVIVNHAPGIDTSYHSLSRVNVKAGDRVKMGDIIGWAGTSAVGANGDHVHNGLWLNGNHVDPLKYLVPGKPVTVSTGGTALGSKPVPIPATGTNTLEEDDMFTDADRAKLNNTYAGVFDGASVLIDGKVQKFNYGILPIVVHNQKLIAKQSGQIAALSAAISAVSGGSPINLTAIEAAAEKGAREALDGLTFKVEA